MKEKERYDYYLSQKLNINIERGWPCKEQLALSMPMLDLVTSSTNLCREVDYRGYAGTGGIEPLKKIFAEVLDVSTEEIYIGSTMSTTIMYDIINKAVLFGLDGYTPWKDVEGVKFICPSPGYEKHFKICQTYGIEMIPVKMFDDGPDMDMVEELVENDDTIKGIWCVPLYSNPTGAIYSDDVVNRLAAMKTKAQDFRIFWDHAYVVHHLTEVEYKIKNILRACEKNGNSDRVFEFTSTSKITFPGGGVGVCASSRSNIEWLKKNSLLQLKSGDKINQYRHTLFFGDVDGLRAHMRKHCEILKPKFNLVDNILHDELAEQGLADWENPKGGYFINIKLCHNVSARKVCELCKEAGVYITPAGSTFPYGVDSEDAFLRIAPTYCSKEELEIAIRVLCAAVKLIAENEGEKI